MLPVYQQLYGTIYYVSNNGNDDNNGQSPSSAWKTIDKLNSLLYEFNPGDVILFERGDLFRGNLEPAPGNSGNWIKYSSYGSGGKPILSGSIQLNSSADWISHNSHIWRTSFDSDSDLGALFMNGDNSAIGERKWAISDLSGNGDFYFDPSGNDKKLYLYCNSGSPEQCYSDIEASVKREIVNLDSRSYILFEGLHLTGGAAHGFGGSDTSHIIIRNCDFSYIGGGFLHMDGLHPVRYGNGIEFWGNGDHNLVDGNRFWEIYDTAVTNQNHTMTSRQEYIYYINNIIWNCGLASFELWNRPSSSILQHIYFLNNTSVNPGFGWGGAEHRPDKNSFHIASYYNEAEGSDLVIKNNIFYSSELPPGSDHHLFFYDENVNGGYNKYIIDNNLWQMPNPLWMIAPSSGYSDFSQWQNTNNQSSNGFVGDPLFVDFNNNDFSLSSFSPAIDRGVECLRQSDFNGNMTLGIPDMGAIEFQ